MATEGVAMGQAIGCGRTTRRARFAGLQSEQKMRLKHGGCWRSRRCLTGLTYRGRQGRFNDQGPDALISQAELAARMPRRSSA
jgi:hypothetical protein